MLKKIAILLVTLSVFAFASFGASQTFASGVNTTSNPGQVKIVTEDGTVYVGTEVDDDGTVVVQRRTWSEQINLLSPYGLVLPKGFATSFAAWLNAVLSVVLVVAALLVLLNLIWGGFEWLTSGGDKGKTENARKRITSAVIGIVIVAASYAILGLVVRFLGFSNIDDVFYSVRPINGNGTTTQTDRVIIDTATPSPTPNPDYNYDTSLRNVL